MESRLSRARSVVGSRRRDARVARVAASPSPDDVDPSARASESANGNDTFETFIRASPVAFGGACATLLLLNRALAGVAPVADASSAQSRADVIDLALSASLVLTGLTWIALRTKPPNAVTLIGVELARTYVANGASSGLRRELEWAWSASSSATNCDCMAVITLKGTRVMQAGVGASALVNQSALAGRVPLGPICRAACADARGNYLANLGLFPGRVEFESFLPINTQAVCVAPIGTIAVLVAASRTQRGFTPNDQRWFAVLAQKLDNALDAHDGAFD